MKNEEKNDTLSSVLGIIILIVLIYFGFKFYNSNIKINKENSIDDKNAVYTTVSYDKLLDDWYANKARAKETYQGKYVKIVNAKVRRVDTYALSINIESATGEYFIESITCYTQNDKQKEFIKTLNSGDNVVVEGKIIYVGDMFEYTLKITDIYK